MSSICHWSELPQADFSKIWKNFVRTNQVEKAVSLGIFSTRFEMLCLHFWYLIYGLFISIFFPYYYNALEAEIEDNFTTILSQSFGKEIVSRGDVVISHSCRTIFYCIIRTLLNRNGGKLKIATNSVHFGSFYRILKQIDLSDDIDIEFYEIDLKANDWTLDTSTIDEEEFKSCDMVLCMHLFGVPLDQDILFELGHRFGIPVIEDCVQSGSLFSNYKGHSLSDVTFWSGGLDKTPSCFGGGFGFFKDTEHGKDLYSATVNMVSDFEFDTWKDRFVSLMNQWLHLVLAKNYFFIINLIGYTWKTALDAKWHELQLKVRKNKAIAPFQHRKSIYLRKPSIYQLMSIRHGITKNYAEFAAQEIVKRDLFLKCIPKQDQLVLFPWMTPKLLQQMRENQGISEFTWVWTPKSDRKALCDWLDKCHFITMINTTWVFNEKSVLKENTGEDICEGLTYLPNLCELDNRQIMLMAKVLVDYCQKERVKKESVHGKNGHYAVANGR